VVKKKETPVPVVAPIPAIKVESITLSAFAAKFSSAKAVVLQEYDLSGNPHKQYVFVNGLKDEQLTGTIPLKKGDKVYVITKGMPEMVVV